jgi:hypothetical protein
MGKTSQLAQAEFPNSSDAEAGRLLTPHPNAGPASEEAAVFQSDALLPAEYFEVFYKETVFGPEKKLMLAILEDGLACFQKYIFAQSQNGRKLFEEAEDWMLEENGDRLFSFENICEVLGLDPRYLRQVALRWKERKLGEFSRTSIFQSKIAGREKKPESAVAVL